MATTSDILNTPTSGLTHIDALLETGPDWNYLTPVGNTIMYSFSTTSGTEPGETGLTTFNATQQANTRLAMQYLAQVTGIQFTETATGSSAQVHFANQNLAGASTSGLCSWATSYSAQQNGTLVSFSVNAYIYMDNVEFLNANSTLSQGSGGYETLLHELGHMLGLKHSFEAPLALPAAQDNTAYTLMSYTSSGGTYSTFRPYDIATLNWLYGADGLRGALGINSATGARYITGTAQADTLTGTANNDTLQGEGGNDTLNGGVGDDTAVFNGMSNSYVVTQLTATSLQVVGADGTDTLHNIELLKFADTTVRYGSTADTTAPTAPTLTAARNANEYITGSTAQFTGTAEANSVVKIYNGVTLIGSGSANASGNFSISSNVLSDGNYLATATATDAAGNVSALSSSLVFKVDVVAPAKPTFSVTRNASDFITGNTAVFTGTAEANAFVQIYNGVNLLGSGSANASGVYSFSSNVLNDGNYTASATATDAAGNVSALSLSQVFKVDAMGPAAPSLSTVRNAAEYISGSVAVFTGTTEANANVKIFNGATLLASGTANSSGAFSLSSSTLADGSYMATATATDAVGNVSALSFALPFKVDIKAPNAPVLGATVNASGFISGTRATFTGTAEANALVKVFNGTTLIGSGNASSTGSYSFSSNTLADGSYAATATATDGAGNVSVLSSSLAFKVESTAPVAPTITTVRNGSDYIAGSKAVFTGTAEANATVKVFNGVVQIGSGIATAAGVFSITSSTLADGSYIATAIATDPAGNVSQLSTALPFKVDIKAPTVPTVTVAAIGTGNAPAFSGTGEAGTTLILIDQGSAANSVLGQTTVAANGTWAIAGRAVADGSYTVKVQSTDLAGNSSTSTGSASFTVASTLNRAGSTGNDSLTGTSGDNAIDGKDGIDTVVYGGARAGYTVTRSTNGHTVSGPDGFDTLVNVERIQFANAALGLDIEGSGGEAYRIYRAAFDRVPDGAGLGYWMKQMDNGMDITQVAQNFINSAEFASLYGADPSNTVFVTKLYNNVLHRTPDADGLNYWLGSFANGLTRAGMLAYFSESDENQDQVAVQIANGFDYVPWLA